MELPAGWTVKETPSSEIGFMRAVLAHRPDAYPAMVWVVLDADGKTRNTANDREVAESLAWSAYESDKRDAAEVEE
jgi:hypothetical protein